MKATGIVRRIDDLGRIVIPKEIRRTLRIGEGCPLEIFTDGDGSVVFKKYSPVKEMGPAAETFAESLSSALGRPCAICDTDRIIAVAGLPRKELLYKPIADNIISCIGNYSKGSTLKRSTAGYRVTEECEKMATVVCPVAFSGDPVGAVMLIKTDKPEDDGAVDMVKLTAVLLGRSL